jgi:hypothetical protein
MNELAPWFGVLALGWTDAEAHRVYPTRYKVQARSGLQILALGVVALALVELVGGVIYLFGSIPDHGETRDATLIDRATGIGMIAISFVTIGIMAMHARQPRELRIWSNGALEVVGGAGTTMLPVRAIQAIEQADKGGRSNAASAGAICIVHSHGSITLPWFDDVARFIVDVRTMNPSVAVFGRWPKATCSTDRRDDRAIPVTTGGRHL